MRISRLNIFKIYISCIIYKIIYGIKYFIKGKIFDFYEKVENVKGLTIKYADSSI